MFTLRMNGLIKFKILNFLTAKISEASNKEFLFWRLSPINLCAQACIDEIFQTQMPIFWYENNTNTNFNVLSMPSAQIILAPGSCFVATVW